MANLTQTVPFSFDDLFNEARSMFQTAGFDVADGSNTTQIAAVNAYLVSALNTNTAINLNETLLPYATKRKNILQDARVLGYEPKHVTSFQYRLKIRLGYEMIGLGDLHIPKYSVFSTSKHNYIFFNNNNNDINSTQDIVVHCGHFKVNDKEYAPSELTFDYDENSGYIKTARTSDGQYVTNLKELHTYFKENRDIEITVKEGELIDYNMDPASLRVTMGSVTVNNETYTRNFIDIPYTNIEDDGINVYVSYFDNYGNYQEAEPYYKTNDYFFEKDTNVTNAVQHKFIRLDDIEMGTPRIYFKYAGLGNGVPFGSVVSISILKSNGESGRIDLDSEKRIFSLPNTNMMYDHQQTDEEFEIEKETEAITEELNVYTNIQLPTISSGSGSGTDKYYVENIFKDASVIACDLVVSGTNEESNQSIVANAPKVYNSANRLVTCLDYKYACNRSPYIIDSTVWGGEDEFPKAPGHIWFSFLPEKSSERGFEHDANNTYYKRRYSELTFNNNTDPQYQKQIRDNYYQRNYILNSEIKTYKARVDKNGSIVEKYSGVWGDLENKKIPGLTFHHRHPIYMNFNYIFNILKYNLKNSSKEVHDTLFNTLDNCFYGNDSLNLEKFDTEYFHTNIVKRIDYLISDLCGFTSELNTQLVLNEKTLCTENWKSEYKDIYIPLAIPFEKYFTDDGKLDTTRLPNIDTEKFISTDNTLGNIFTDWTNIIKNGDNSDIDVKLFVAPVKCKFNTTVQVTNDFYTELRDKLCVRVEVPFNISPNNDGTNKDFSNVNVNIKNSSGKTKITNAQLNHHYAVVDTNTKPVIMFKRLGYNDEFWNNLVIGDIVEIECTRTCGYYYLFNTFKKEILVHLFVNGDFEGFSELKNGLRTNDYYNIHLDEISSTWNTEESQINDKTNYIDITYTTPRGYLYTTDKRYITTTADPMNDVDTTNKNSNLSQYNKNALLTGSRARHYITTEGYIVNPDEEGYNTEYYNDEYYGEAIRDYNPNMYKYTLLKTDMFKQNLYLNIKYPSLNFRVIKNVIPRLNTAKFKNANEIY